jgi:hypothetical protein
MRGIYLCGVGVRSKIRRKLLRCEGVVGCNLTPEVVGQGRGRAVVSYWTEVAGGCIAREGRVCGRVAVRRRWVGVAWLECLRA